MRTASVIHPGAAALALLVAVAGCAAPPAARGARTAPAGASSAARPAADHEEDCEPAAAEDPPRAEGEHTTLDDGLEAPPHGAAPDVGGGNAPAPFAELTDAEIEARLRADIGALGAISVGRTNGGALVAGVRMPEGENWQVVSPALAWGTEETVSALAHAIDAVAARFPDTPRAFIGDISARSGGHVHPHISHQSGRDVDLGYYLTGGHRWYASANGSNLDRARTWHLVRTLIADSDVDLILVDRQIQRALKAYALGLGEDAAWLDAIFQVGGRSRRPLIFHAEGHATHLHVRFFNPKAQELGRRAYRFMIARRVVAPPTLYVTHTVKPGETLSHLARRYNVTPEAIKRANALTGDLVRLNRPYKIPQPGGIAMPAPAVIPPRRVPPPLRAAEPGAPPGTPCHRVSARSL
jgi:penicillin-insensitive murein endopeptidase